MKSLLTVLLALWLSTAFAACNTVSSAHPVGDPISDEKLAEYSGVWRAADGILYVKGLEDGRAKTAWVEWSEDEFKLTQFDLILGEVDDVQYLNMMEPAEDQEDTDDESAPKKTAYFFFRLVPGDDGSVVLYPPQSEAFKSAVRAGILEGQIEDNAHSSDVHITSAKGALEAFFEVEKIGTQFEMDAPLILLRIQSLK